MPVNASQIITRKRPKLYHSQQLAVACRADFLLLHGGRGAAKSTGMLECFHDDVGSGWGEGWNGVILRNEYKELLNLVAESHKLFDKPYIYKSSPYHTFTFANGEKLEFVAMKRIEQYTQHHGFNRAFIGIDELTQMSKPVFDKLCSTLRSADDGVRSRLVATTNSSGMYMQWVKDFFKVHQLPNGKIFKLNLMDTGCALEMSFLENTALIKNDPKYIARLLSLPLPHVRSWVFNDWSIVSGGAFDDIWEDRTHFIEPFDIPDTFDFYYSFDDGSSVPFSFGFWAVADDSYLLKDYKGNERVIVRGDIFRMHEYYGSNGEPNVGLKKMTNREKGIEAKKIIADIEFKYNIKFSGGVADSSINATHGHENTIADEIDMEFTTADKRSRATGFSLLRDYLIGACPPTKGHKRETTGMFVFNTCANFKRTVPLLIRDLKKLDDIADGQEDHNYDETRYFLTFLPKSNLKTYTMRG